LQETERQYTAREATLYTVTAWAILAIIFYYLQDSPAQSLTKVTFIGLAALTLPHMLLVDYANSSMRRKESL
jgi:hypothetical protein